MSIKRLEEFLDMDELDPDNVQRISCKELEIMLFCMNVYHFLQRKNCR